jgi:hypothetical protein
MAGILEKLLRPQKRTTYRSIKVLELESAKEILAEVFHVQPSVVDDMIQRRLEDRGPGHRGRKALRGWAVACHVLPGE